MKTHKSLKQHLEYSSLSTVSQNRQYDFIQRASAQTSLHRYSSTYERTILAPWFFYYGIYYTYYANIRMPPRRRFLYCRRNWVPLFCCSKRLACRCRDCCFQKILGHLQRIFDCVFDLVPPCTRANGKLVLPNIRKCCYKHCCTRENSISPCILLSQTYFKYVLLRTNNSKVLSPHVRGSARCDSKWKIILAYLIWKLPP